jgi:hypothetical protein
MSLLIGIHGKARAGKDTAAAHMVRQYGFVRTAFADPLKRAAKEMFGLTHEQTYSDELKEVLIPHWGYSPRQLFQLLGTESGREVFGEDMWLRRWAIDAERIENEGSHVVVTDVRFANEAEMIRKRGGVVVHLIRPMDNGLGRQAFHASERGLEIEAEDVVIQNNGSLEQLYSRVDLLVAETLHRSAEVCFA